MTKLKKLKHMVTSPIFSIQNFRKKIILILISNIKSLKHHFVKEGNLTTFYLSK